MMVKFKCPKCGETRLEACFHGPHNAEVIDIDESRRLAYGEIQSFSEVDRFQCYNCGWVIVGKDEETIVDENIEPWCQKNCEQE